MEILVPGHYDEFLRSLLNINYRKRKEWVEIAFGINLKNFQYLFFLMIKNWHLFWRPRFHWRGSSQWSFSPSLDMHESCGKNKEKLFFFCRTRFYETISTKNFSCLEVIRKWKENWENSKWPEKHLFLSRINFVKTEKFISGFLSEIQLWMKGF